MPYADDLRKSLAPQDGVQTSDTGKSILDGGLHDFLDRMGPRHLGYLYDYWNKNPCCSPQHTTPVLGTQSSDTDLLNQLNSMGFGFMDGCAKGLDNLAKAGGELSTLAGGTVKDISGAWTDKAGQAAGDKFGDLQKAATDYQESVQNLATAMHSIWKTTRQAVQTLADFPKGADNEQGNVVGGNGGARFMGFYGTEDKWNVGQWSHNIDAINSLLKSVNPDTQTDAGTSNKAQNETGGNKTGGTNYTPQDLATPGTVQVNDTSKGGNGEADNHYSNEVIQIMNDFNNNYDAVVRNYRAQLQATVTNIEQQMATLQDTIKQKVTNLDPFGGLNVNAPDTKPGSSQSPSQPSQPSQNGSGPSNSGGHTTSSGGGPSSIGTSAASFTPPPISPSTTGAAGAGGAPTGGAQPGAGAMPTIPPISGSTSTTTSGATGTGLPGAGVPGTGTGMPGTGGVPGSTPESLTVQSGGNTIGMSTPDSQGNMQLTVTDSSGHPQTYQIGFGQGTPGTTGMPGSPTQPGMPGATPMHTGMQSTAMQGTGGFGPTGTPADPSQLAGGAGVQHITPGPDGHAVIHDGNITITASEPQGQGGPVQVTVDDGTGHPSTYTLGDQSGAGLGTPTSTVGGTSPSAWLSPDAAQQHAAAVGGAVSGQDANSLVGGAAGGGGMHGGGMHGGGGHGGAGLAAAMGGGGGTGISNVLGGAANHAASAGAVSGVGDVGLAGTDVSHAAAPGGAGLAQGPGGGQSSGGAPMMGGMGMGGMGGGGQGGDTERGASQWRTQGHLFDNVLDDNVAGNFSGVLGEETGDQGR